MSATFFYKTTCTTCRDARAIVRKLATDVLERDYAKRPLTRGEVEQIVAAIGSVAAVLNTRHAIAKERGWKDKPPATVTFVSNVLQEPNLLRRPILLKGKRAVVGKDERAFKELLRG